MRILFSDLILNHHEHIWSWILKKSSIQKLKFVQINMLKENIRNENKNSSKKTCSLYVFRSSLTAHLIHMRKYITAYRRSSYLPILHSKYLETPELCLLSLSVWISFIRIHDQAITPSTSAHRNAATAPINAPTNGKTPLPIFNRPHLAINLGTSLSVSCCSLLAPSTTTSSSPCCCSAAPPPSTPIRFAIAMSRSTVPSMNANEYRIAATVTTPAARYILASTRLRLRW